MTAPFTLPSPVVLPSASIIENARLLAALGNPARQTIHVWRKYRGFPIYHKNGRETFVLTADLEMWLIAQGFKCKRV